MKIIELLSIVAISFFILLGLNYLDAILLLNGMYEIFPRGAFWEDPCALLYGPLIYSFSLQLKGRTPGERLYHFLHFLPFLLLQMILAIFLLSLLVTLVQYLGIRQAFSLAFLPLIILSIVLSLRILLFAMQQPLFDLPIGREVSVKLTLKMLAQTLSASERAVSQVINNHMAENFYDLINTYRIEAAKGLLQSSEASSLTILEILYEVGFNSKSSFNTQFKKKTGLTPSQFRKAQ